MERGIGEGPAVYVHVGGCHMAGKRSEGVARDQALRALTDGGPSPVMVGTRLLITRRA
ncbi:DUF6233 domain-containing protein [Streptomyces sp. SAS_270]|uniref:DUF6233 domain-containing protein n=1 Tax=Streptomyces sp. SAS_270 TaxID=3412748 RepID=UPI00403C84B2